MQKLNIWECKNGTPSLGTSGSRVNGSNLTTAAINTSLDNAGTLSLTNSSSLSFSSLTTTIYYQHLISNMLIITMVYFQPLCSFVLQTLKFLCFRNFTEPDHLRGEQWVSECHNKSQRNPQWWEQQGSCWAGDQGESRSGERRWQKWWGGCKGRDFGDLELFFVLLLGFSWRSPQTRFRAVVTKVN